MSWSTAHQTHLLCLISRSTHEGDDCLVLGSQMPRSWPTSPRSLIISTHFASLCSTPATKVSLSVHQTSQNGVSGRCFVLNGRRNLANVGFIGDYLFFDTMMTTSFGYSCRLLQDETHRHVVSDIRESNIRIGTLLQEPRLVIARLDKRLFPRAIAARDRFVRFVASTFKQRAKDQGVGAARDVFSVLLSPPVSDQDVQMGQKLAAAEAATLIVAGKKRT